MWAGAFWWKSALLVTDVMSWSSLFESGMLSSLFSIRHLSAMLDPTVGAGPGPVPEIGPTGAL